MIDKGEVELKLKELREWFQDNPKLPDDIDAMLLKRFLKCMYNNVEETKKLIEINYSLRNKNPHLFINRDPDDENTKKAFGVSDLVLLPGMTPERHKILLFRMTDMDPSTRNSTEEIKIFFMLADCRFTMSDLDDLDNETIPKKLIEYGSDTNQKTVGIQTNGNKDYDADDQTFYDAVEYLQEDEAEPAEKKVVKQPVNEIDDLAEGDILVADVGGYTMRHCARLSIYIFRVYLKFLQEAYPVRLRAMHFINCPTYLDKMLAFIRPFINDDVFKLMHFHVNGLENLYNDVPRDLLPYEYGGKAGSMKELTTKWLNKMEEKRSYLMDPKHWYVKSTAPRRRWSLFG